MGNEITIENSEQLNQFLFEIDELLKQGLTAVANKKYVELIIRVEGQEFNGDLQLKADIFSSFAYFLFGLHEYESFFKILYKAQQYGYSKDEIEKLLWEAFVEPNVNEFQTMYETNINYLISNNYINTTISMSFQELPFWLLPTGIENEYYLYDKKQKLIQEKVSLYKYQKLEVSLTQEEFSDYLLIENDSWSNILSITNQVRKQEKKTYIVLNNIGKFLSCMQGALLNKDIISNVLIFDDFNSMDDYFKNTDVYLPRNIINLVDQSKNAENYINVIHNYRINKEKRKRDNILLSICIPSFNRGNRAYENVIHLLQSRYDEEIEFIVSNNGTQNDTKRYYEKIEDIGDARLKYFSFEENKGFAINFAKVCELAGGKYILVLSDEDLVDIGALDKVMNILIHSKDSLAVIRTSSDRQSKPPVKIASAGKDALLTFMLTSNYVSGIIFNNKLLRKYKGIEYIYDNQDNSVCLFYPHMFLELLLSQYGSVQGTDLILIHEGRAEKTDIGTMEHVSTEVKIPYYSTIEGRKKQHKSFFDIFKSLEICEKDSKLLREMYIRLCTKTLYLSYLSIIIFYKKTKMNTSEMLREVYELCISKGFFEENDKLYQEYVTIIRSQYENYRKQIK